MLNEVAREWVVGDTAMLIRVNHGKYDHPIGIIPRMVAEFLGLPEWRENNGTGAIKLPLFEIISSIDSYNNPDPLGTWVVCPLAPMSLEEMESHLQKAWDTLENQMSAGG